MPVIIFSLLLRLSLLYFMFYKQSVGQEVTQTDRWLTDWTDLVIPSWIILNRDRQQAYQHLSSVLRVLQHYLVAKSAHKVTCGSAYSKKCVLLRTANVLHGKQSDKCGVWMKMRNQTQKTIFLYNNFTSKICHIFNGLSEITCFCMLCCAAWRDKQTHTVNSNSVTYTSI